METNAENTQIQLVQKPVIEHKLAEIGKKVDERLEILNIDNQVATIDTLKALKEMRTELNKELADYETLRKAIKKQSLDPYAVFEVEYKVQLFDKYTLGISKLSDKIALVEIAKKTEKKKAVVDYFNELCAAEKIDFLKFEQLGIEINLSTTVNKYIDQVYSFVMRVGDDLLLINSLEYAAETLTEYKGNGLNASLAISKVKTRKDAEKLEEQQLKQKEIDRREGLLRGLSMVYRDITNTFDYVGDNSIFIAQSEINGLSKEEFTKLFVTLESRINAEKEASKPKTTATPPTSVKIGLFDTPTATPAPQPLPAPVEVAPVVEEKKIFARFEVSGTRERLLALGQYMKSNNLVYTNIK